jgi:glycosyltransferase involved in cell wall biosynthesis
MPIIDNEVGKGKCSFKLIQYMGLGIVSVASDVGSNKEVVENKKNGFLVGANDSWENVIKYLIQHQTDFNEIGTRARKTIMDIYSFESNTQFYLDFIKEAR